MTFEEALERIDGLSPNSFTAEEKLQWLNDCESLLRTETVKQYAYAETTVQGECVALPEGVRGADVSKVYLNGVMMPKTDVRSGKIYVPKPNRKTRIGIVYLQRHVPVKNTVYEGSIELESGAMTLEENPFYGGQDILIDCPMLKGEFTVLGSSANRLFLNAEAEGSTEGKVTLRLNTPLCAPAPYDNIYLYYVMAQMDYYGKDFESYNHNSILYREALEALQKVERRTAPLDRTAVMRNVW